ncbi:MAG: TonB-dependent receptor [Flavipsychrobacter sp.]|nr:TonB-dependent receptor [Flavipsychrobacter sp.]
MYKQIIFFFLLMQVSISVMAVTPPGNTLTGVVKDNKGNPLPGAIVELPDMKIGTAADSLGVFLIKDLPKGKFIVIASLVSYSRTAIAVTINGNTTQNFVLNESVIESKEVVITGQSKATEINRSPVPVVAINNQYLKENISSNIIDALSNVPGVSQVTTGPNVSKPFIRGLGYNRILTLYDGMRQEGQQWGDEHGIEVDEFSVERVELVKGPASLVYGSDALAGVVNLIPTPPAPDGKVIGNVSGEYQSNNGGLAGSAMMSGNKKGFYWLGRVSHKQATNYTTPVDGRVYGTSYNETDANASFGLNKKWGFSHLDFSMFNDLQSIPDGSRDSVTRKFTKQITEADTVRDIVSNKELSSYKIPVLHQHIQHYRIMSSNNFHVLNGLLAVNLGMEQSIRQEFSHPEYAAIAGLFLRLSSYTYDVKYYFHNIKGWDVTAGVNGMYQVNDVTKGTEFVVPSYHQFDIGPFAVAKKNIGKLDIAGGIRFDSRTFHNDALFTATDPATGFDKYVPATTAGATQHFYDYSHTFTGMTYSLGLTYILSKSLAFKANVARGFRAPNIAEISANGIHPGTNIYQLGNANFKPEFSLQEDIGIEYTLQHVSVNISLFNNDIANYIYNQKLLTASGQDSVIVPGNRTFQFQAAAARLYGGELSLDIHPHPFDWLHFENSLSVVYAVNKGVNGVTPNDSERYLPFIPPVHGTSELRGSFSHLSAHMRNSFIKVQMVAYARQDHVYLAYNTETTTPGYILFHAGIGTDVTDRTGKVIFNIAAFGNNLLNTAYQDHLNRLKYFEEYPGDPRGRSGIYNMGRNIGIKISVPFTSK